MERHRTKDEKYILRLYEEVLKQTDIDDPVDRYHIGQLIGLHPRAVDTICNLLIRANFIKKKGEVEVMITPQGIRLAESLRE